MSAAGRMSVSVETVITELSLAIGQFMQRLRAESNPDELTWSQTVALSRLERAGPMTTAELARADFVKPQSMGATLAELEREGLVARQRHPTDASAARRSRPGCSPPWPISIPPNSGPSSTRPS
jgi:DNA-binding transcriptional ArsR family regulator